MDISFAHFWEQALQNPILLISVLLTLGVIFVNGWTDAPNAIATCFIFVFETCLSMMVRVTGLEPARRGH